MPILFPDVFETERLKFKQVCHENIDLFKLYHIRAHDDGIEEIANHLPWDPHESPKETFDLLNRAETEWNDGKAARYFIRTKSSEDFIGYTKLEIDWERQTGSLGIWLRKPYWGREYSLERAEALIELAFERLSLDLIVATHQDGNEKSKRAIEKYIEQYGGQYDGYLRNWIVTSDDVADAHRYTITVDQYHANKPSQSNVDFPRSVQ